MFVTPKNKFPSYPEGNITTGEGLAKVLFDSSGKGYSYSVNQIQQQISIVFPLIRECDLKESSLEILNNIMEALEA